MNRRNFLALPLVTIAPALPATTVIKMPPVPRFRTDELQALVASMMEAFKEAELKGIVERYPGIRGEE